MPPLTDIIFDVDELGAWGGAAGSGRLPYSVNSIGYPQRLKAHPVAAHTPYAMEVTTIPASPPAREFTIAGPLTSVNVYSKALAIYPDAHTKVTDYIVTTTGDITTLTWDSGGQFPVGCTFKLINQGNIYGLGGTGAGASATTVRYPSPNGTNGSAGGNALNLNGKTVSIDNSTGNIFGGGGGGGSGGYAAGNIVATIGIVVAPGTVARGLMAAAGGGGGGRGGITSNGGNSNCTNDSEFGNVMYYGNLTPYHAAIVQYGTAFNPYPAIIDTIGTVDSGGVIFFTINSIAVDGANGNASGAGNGGAGGSTQGNWQSDTISFCTGGNGGNGGDWGTAGSAGTAGTTVRGGTGADGIKQGTGGLGGAAGKAINLAGGAVTWLGGNNPSQVKGAVS